MTAWRTAAGTALLLAAFLVHYANALWSIYVRQSLRLSPWQWVQIALGLCIPLLLMLHVIGTRIAESPVRRATAPTKRSCSRTGWCRRGSASCRRLRCSRYGPTPASAFIFGSAPSAGMPTGGLICSRLALLLPTLALAGYVAGGNEVMRASRNPDYVRKRCADREPDRGRSGRNLPLGEEPVSAFTRPGALAFGGAACGAGATAAGSCRGWRMHPAA